MYLIYRQNGRSQTDTTAANTAPGANNVNTTSSTSTNTTEPNELLHMYIYDYCKKRNFPQAARAFAAEAHVQQDRMPPIDIPSGFLSDWWGVFWDVYNAKHNEAVASKEAQVLDQVYIIIRHIHQHFICSLLFLFSFFLLS